MDFALGTLPGRLAVVKLACPTTTSAGALLKLGMRFQIRTRLWLVSATTTWTPSEATAVGRRSVVGVAGMFSIVLAKSGCPSTTVACPTHTGHFRLYVSCAPGLGSIP